MFLKEGPVFLLVVCEGLKKSVPEEEYSIPVFCVEQISIGEVDQLS